MFDLHHQHQPPPHGLGAQAPRAQAPIRILLSCDFWAQAYFSYGFRAQTPWVQAQSLHLAQAHMPMMMCFTAARAQARWAQAPCIPHVRYNIVIFILITGTRQRTQGAELQPSREHIYNTDGPFFGTRPNRGPRAQKFRTGSWRSPAVRDREVDGGGGHHSRRSAVWCLFLLRLGQQ